MYEENENMEPLRINEIKNIKIQRKNKRLMTPTKKMLIYMLRKVITKSMKMLLKINMLVILLREIIPKILLWLVKKIYLSQN